MTVTDSPSRVECVVKTAVVHMLTYTLAGTVAFSALDYPSLFAAPGLRDLMRPSDDPLLVYGPLYQVLRGALFGLLFHHLRAVFFQRPRGWISLWATLVVVGIFGTFGPSPGSLEGAFFTVVPPAAQLRGLPEVLVQSLGLSALLFYWVKHPKKRWLSWTLGVLAVLLALLTILGTLAASKAA